MAQFETRCPHCSALLKVDDEVRAVVDCTPPEAPRAFENLEAAVGSLRKAGAERESKFQESIEAERSKKGVLEKKFEELFKKAKTDDAPPVRDIDLD